MNFDIGCAQSLYSESIHPRVLASDADVEILRRRALRENGKKVMDGLRVWSTPTVEKILAATTSTDVRSPVDGAYFGTPVVFGLDDIAMVGRLDKDDRAVEAVRRFLLAMAEAELSGEINYALGSLRHQGMAYDLLYNHLPEEDRSRIATWMVLGIRETLDRIQGFLKGSGANTNVCFMMSALFNLLAVKGDPGVPNLDREQAKLLTLFEAALHGSIGPNGFPVEDIGYGTALVPYLSFVVEALRRAGLYDAYTECPRYTRFGRAILHFVQPWGEHLTSTGDQYDGIIDRQFVLSRMAEMNGDPTMRWMIGTLHQSEPAASMFAEVALDEAKRFSVPVGWLSLAMLKDIRKQKHPSRAKIPTAYSDPLRGIVSLRSGWDKDSTFVTFDGSQRSPGCSGHQHSSCGNFTLSALGEYFAIDCGRYNMEQNCHNVVLAGGASGRSSEGQWQMAWHHGVLTDYSPGPFVDIASVDSSLQHDCYWAFRHLGLVKGKGMPAYVWCVDDINKANDWAEFVWQLHTSPENVITLQKSMATVKGWRNGNCLDIHLGLPDPKSYPKSHRVTFSKDEATGSSYNYIQNPHERANAFKRPSDMLHHSVFVRPRLKATVEGFNGRFMSVMLPRRKGESPSRFKRIPSQDNSIAARITFGDIEDTLIWAYEHPILEAGDIKARGRWCLVRRSLKTGRVLDYTIKDGTRLEVSGKILPATR